MSDLKCPDVSPDDVLAIVLGGGQGTRLFPLTKNRAKPAVPLAGKYRLVDIPISNCINAGIKRIYLLTQFNSASLHRHISQSYKFDHFTRGFVEILAAEQTLTNRSWYQGTADAVRKNLPHFLNNGFQYALILSGDQLYRMDFRKMLAQHLMTGAELTIATLRVPEERAPAFGIMQIDESLRINNFVEKPQDPEVIRSLKIPEPLYDRLKLPREGGTILASMGIYLFSKEALLDLLNNAMTDFGKHIIPKAINVKKVYAFIFDGYWEDVGTIRSFFDANIDLVSELPKFNFFDMTAPIFSRPRFLPASKVNGAELDHVIISDGSIINYARLSYCVIGLRSRIERGSFLSRTIVFGSDFYESEESIRQSLAEGKPKIGIGSGTRIENAIIDKNARIGDNCIITPMGKPDNMDHPMFYIRDGIVIIPKNGVVPHGTII